MKTTALLATLAMMILPNVAAAMGCSSLGHEETASMTCAEGTAYDKDTQRCVPVTG